jgi:hypothetical protein
MVPVMGRTMKCSGPGTPQRQSMMGMFSARYRIQFQRVRRVIVTSASAEWTEGRRDHGQGGG